MIGIIDVGGGMRGVYTSGLYDCFLDNGVYFDYYLGVSAGSANLITYIASQRGRTKVFYTEYAFRREYMSLYNLIKRGSFIDLDYVFSTISNFDGENPLDYEAFSKSDGIFKACATRACDASAVYLSREDISQDDYSLLKASCCLPAVCKPVKIKNDYYYDGAIAEPIPIEKAFSDGCDKVVLVLTKPREQYAQKSRFSKPLKCVLHNKPIADKVENLYKICDEILKKVKQYENEGKLLVIEPEDCFNMNTLKRDYILMSKLYGEGYEDGLKAIKNKEFFKTKG